MVSEPIKSIRDMEPDRRSTIDQAAKVGEEFCRLYYKTLEQRPHRVHLLYLDASVVIWDGNPYVGLTQLQKYFEDLPSLTFSLGAMDSQPLSSAAVGEQKSFLINVCGTFRISGVGSRSFIQNFVVTEEAGKWKVASDVFRTQQTIPEPPA